VNGFPPRQTIREFLVEFMGSLVPGFLFVFLATVGFGWPVAALCGALLSPGSGASLSFAGCAELLGVIRFETIFFVLAFSYVLGHFFFRQDPKVPDESSVFCIRQALKSGDGAVRFPKVPKELSKKPLRLFYRCCKVAKLNRLAEWVLWYGDRSSRPNVEFPYLFLHEYLKDRELKHLAEMVPWHGEDPNTHRHRTKAFVNILKMRLEFAFPEKCGTITRNEAHVRLMSSVWYLSRSLMWVSAAGFAIALMAAGRAWTDLGISQLVRFFPLFLSCGLIVIGTFWARHTIEKFFHYQRVREIIHVLEMAYVAAKDKPEILEDLNIDLHHDGGEGQPPCAAQPGR